MRPEIGITLVVIFLSMPTVYLITTNEHSPRRPIESALPPALDAEKPLEDEEGSKEVQTAIDINTLLGQERSLFEKADLQQEVSQNPKQEFGQQLPALPPILIGTIIEDDHKKALVRSQGPEQSHILISIGETIGEFKLIDVTNEQITLNNMNTGDTEVVLILRE